jgi:glycosyltransferase involved in cell wall biosynthesis
MHFKKNIAIIIPGGIGTGKNNIGIPILERLTKNLAKDFSVTVFQLHKTNDSYTPVGFDLVEIFSGNPMLKVIKFIFIFRKYQWQRKFVAVHGFWALPAGFFAVIAGKLWGIKSIISLQGGDAISIPEIRYGQLQRWLPRILILWSLHKADILISPSFFMINNLRKRGLSRDQISYIPLGVDVNLFAFKERTFSAPLQFLHIGNFNEVKDQSTLLRAFKIISDQIPCRLTVIGVGELEQKIKLLAQELKLDGKIDFRKPVVYEQLPAWYNQSDIMLHTSLSEGHPIVVEEAMSTGVLVCGTRVGLMSDLPDCCLTENTRDYKSLASSVVELINNHDQMKKMQRRAHLWATSHSDKWTAEEIGKLYNNE